MPDATEQHLERIKAAAKCVSIAVDSLRAADRDNVAARSRHAIAVALLHDAIEYDQPEPGAGESGVADVSARPCDCRAILAEIVAAIARLEAIANRPPPMNYGCDPMPVADDTKGKP